MKMLWNTRPVEVMKVQCPLFWYNETCGGCGTKLFNAVDQEASKLKPNKQQFCN